MTGQEYQKLAMRTKGDGFTDLYEQIKCAGMGLAGESGEVIDYLKKVFYQGHKLDINKVAEEVGDILWYCALMADAIGGNIAEIMFLNIEKLRKRYPAGFEVEKSINREW